MHANARRIFSLGDITNMMNLVFDTPVAPNALRKSFGRLEKRGHIVARFSFDSKLSPLLKPTFALDSNQRLQTWPIGNVIQGCAQTHHPAFKPPVPLTDLGIPLLSHKIGLNALVQVALISFQRPQIVIATLDNQATGFF
jgi:hypothetical protein